MTYFFLPREMRYKKSPKPPNRLSKVANKSPGRHRPLVSAKRTSQVAKSGNPELGLNDNGGAAAITSNARISRSADVARLACASRLVREMAPVAWAL